MCVCVLWITHKSAPPLAPVSVSGGRFRFLPPARNVDRLRRPGLAGVEPAQPKFLAAHPAATAPVISLRSPRAAGCKSSPPLTFFKLGDPPLDRPQQAPAGRARPIVPWKGANWCAAAVGLPAAPQCQPVLRWASECVTEEVSASELWWQPSRRKSQLLSSARQRTRVLSNLVSAPRAAKKKIPEHFNDDRSMK